MGAQAAGKSAGNTGAGAKGAGRGGAGQEDDRQLNVETLAHNLAQLVEEGGKAMAAYLAPREAGQKKDDMSDDIADALKTFSQVAEYWMGDPQRTVEAQTRLMTDYMSIWSNSLKKISGENVSPVAAPEPKDGRFKDDGWNVSPFFDALKQTYLVTSNWAEDMVKEAEGLDPHVKHKAEFLVKQVSNAIAPSNFVLTNPELIRETLSSSGENLVKGMQNFTEDLKEGKGDLKIRQTDIRAFEVGRNLATTPGKVVFENELMQLIQYEPTTPTVKKTPVLISPPWINKYYILDLTAEKSLIKWLVGQGLTVFVISWVNPDARLAEKSFGDYMRDGIMKALDVVALASGERQVHAVGYCIGGTLLSITLAYMAATGDDRIVSATFLTTQIDFTYAGDLKVFVDEGQISALERKMKAAGYLEGSQMARSFNLLRSNDLIWPYVVNNYMKGKSPFPFDLLYWNSDSTRMPAAGHSFYLRNCYLTNSISKGETEIGGIRIDISKVQVPVYSLATREDHIAPPKSVYVGASLMSGPLRYVMAGSGHIAGVVNPPARNKYQYWSDGPAGAPFEDWVAGAQEHAGSWWPDWYQWFSNLHPEEVDARPVGGGRLTPIEDAPGRYVKVKS
ncbi:class I poly(R)-hydroxyalkanoic acid synthase [Xanthobacter sp. TB0139]